MEKNLKLALGTLVGVTAVALVAVAVMVTPRSQTPVADATEGTAVDQPGSARITGPMTGTTAPAPSATREPDGTSAFVRSGDAGAPPYTVPDNTTAAALDAIQSDASIPGTAAWWDDKVDFLDPEQALAVILDTFGSIEDAYAATADPLIREDLILLLTDPDFDFDEQEIATGLLASEHDTELRALILESIEPQGYYDDDRHDYVDLVLLHLLNQTVPTPIGEREWMARLDLARILDTDSAIRWAEDAAVAHPGSDQVNLLASTILLEMNAQTTVSADSLVRSTDAIAREVNNGTIANYQPADRIRAYNALLWGENLAMARDIWQRQLANELDLSVQRALQELLSQTQATAQVDLEP